MNVGNISALTAEQTSQAVGLAVFKSALKIQEQAAMQLLEAIPSPTSAQTVASNPPHLGQAVDVRV
ncbi:MAG: YjfB family protein [Betaproteobacteria bacterium]|nr:YjfB family protein [Betaproteobacteria bacterium]